MTFDEAFQKCRQNIARGDKDSFPRTVSNGGRNINKEVHCMACCDPGVTCENMSIQYKGVSEKFDEKYIGRRVSFRGDAYLTRSSKIIDCVLFLLVSWRAHDGLDSTTSVEQKWSNASWALAVSKSGW